MRLYFPLFSLLSVALAAGRTSPPSGCLVVSKTASSGQYKTVQSAVNALSTTSTSPQCIFIYQGTYNEQVYIPSRKAALTIYGYTTDTSTYTGNTVTITQKLSQDDVANNDLTATLRAHSANFKLYNVNLVNTRGQGSQALALSAQADKQGYYGVQFHGYQDTVLANTGAQLYAKCLIVGATDFIFGQTATAWFDRVDIRVLAASIGYITANGRDSESNPSFYVINNSNVAAASGNSVKAGTYYLGRPWRNYSRVVFQRTSLSNVVNGEGWKVWGSSDPRTDHVYYGEYANTGDGAKGTRAAFAKKLASPVAIETVLGSGYQSWVDRSYLS
ncbi:carbohydrate esterase family 8 protein [Westerdykella ornata]|uniref:Pectinesterase n=1 Tax=Westerdykella ornata TaxID=318751 RepID=A0A6A6J9U0_WESOR|nr:carbohydrate esterase family 8 protein [Westerdykella ornata]KAF2273027.1 carbohydrate esterase family 8 protein [Westerdykella ornata]